MNIIGISCFYHDAAAALIQDGMLIAAAEEERFSRKKHDSEFPRLAIQFCLNKGGIRPEELDYVVFYEKPFRKLDRILMMVLQTYPRSHQVFREAMIHWFTNKFWVKDILQREFGIDEGKILFSEHHLSHAASAFFCSPFEKAAILTVDGVGEWSTATFGIGQASWNGHQANEIQIKKEIYFPHSLGLLYSAFTAFLGFEVNEGEYKVMGMSAYGKPRFVEKIHKTIEVASDGSFWLDMDYFDFSAQTRMPITQKFIRLFGEPRIPESTFILARDQHYADIAASIQLVTEDVMVKLSEQLYKETKLDFLCIAGGVGLNGLANAKILRNTPFKALYVHPAAGDSGGAIGAALWAYHVVAGKPRRFVMQHCYWGEAYSDAQIRTELDRMGVQYQYFHREEDLLDLTASAIAEGEVVGWFQGRFEWGPRALGNRSILADPRRSQMKEIVNQKIKFREPFRPFAPSVLVEKVEEYFDLPIGKQNLPMDFMLQIELVRPEKQRLIPAVTHEDGTGRLQSVRQEHNPRYYRLIQRFEEITGVPVILNTSFNLKGEPIVNTASQAFRTFERGALERLVLGNCVITKK